MLFQIFANEDTIYNDELDKAKGAFLIKGEKEHEQNSKISARGSKKEF